MTLKGNGIRVIKRKNIKNMLNFSLDCMWVVNHLPSTLLGLLSFFRPIFPFYIHWKHQKSRTLSFFRDYTLGGLIFCMDYILWILKILAFSSKYDPHKILQNFTKFSIREFYFNSHKISLKWPFVKINLLEKSEKTKIKKKKSEKWKLMTESKQQ